MLLPPATLIEDLALLLLDKAKFLYHISKTTSIQRLYIFSSIVSDILAITHRDKYPGFSHCYKIVIHSWFLQSLTKLLHVFINHCFEYFALYIRRHPFYNSLQLIELPPIPFYTLILDFILALPLALGEFNTLMSVMCKFSKCITFIKGIDTWSIE